MRKWKPIKGYEGYYEVSNDGLVRSLDRYVAGRLPGVKRFAKGKELTSVPDGYGYPFICLNKKSRKKYKKIHQLVAETFIGKEKGKQVNHKDGDPSNNCVENLEYVTPKENTWHGITELGHRRDGEYHWHSKVTNEEVKRMRKMYKTGDYTQSDLSDIFGIHRGQISKILNHKSWKNIQT
jgi:hypothetical protein